MTELAGSGIRSVKNIGVEPLPPNAISGGIIVDTDSVFNSLSKLLKKKKIAPRGRKVAIALGGGAVLLKRLVVQKDDVEGDIEDFLFAEAEQSLQHDMEDLIIRYEEIDQTGNDTSTYMIAGAKREAVEGYLETIHRLNMKAAVIDVDAFCLSNIFESTYGLVSGLVGLVDIGSTSSQFVALVNGVFTFNREIPVGGADYTQALSQGLGIGSTEAEALKIASSMNPGSCPDQVRSIFHEVNQRFVDELQGTISFLMQSGDIPPDIEGFDIVFLTGGSAMIYQLDAMIAKAIEKPVNILNPFQKMNIDGRKFPLDRIMSNSSLYSVVLGLGLRKIEDNND